MVDDGREKKRRKESVNREVGVLQHEGEAYTFTTPSAVANADVKFFGKSFYLVLSFRRGRVAARQETNICLNDPDKSRS